MMFVMFIAFFTSRVILDKLGVEDFGIYNVVGGIAIMFVFFSSSMANATQRFLNIELGKENTVGAKQVVNQHLLIYGLIAIIVLIVAETFGLWFVKNKLVIPDTRMDAAIWVYQFTVISLCITLLGVVFNSLIIAHEDMRIYSYVGIVEGVLKLVIAYLISIISFDRLIFLALAFAILTTAIQIYYFIYCRKRYQECVLEWFWNTKQIKQTFSFISWNTVGTAVYAINSQGINVLLNMFFGPGVNAARGIAYQIDGAVNNFSNNFFTAVRPQITKAYAKQDFDYLNKLFFQSSKYSFFLLWIISLPIIICINPILSIWLVEVPEWTATFSKWVLAYSLVNVLNNPVWSIALSTGKLGKYISIGSSIFLLSFPISYIILKQGGSPVSVFIVLFVVRSVFIIATLIIIHSYITFSYKEYAQKVLFPCGIVTCISSLFAIMISKVIQGNSIMEITSGIVTAFITVTCVWFLGMSLEDKLFAKSLIQNKLRKK